MRIKNIKKKLSSFINLDISDRVHMQNIRDYYEHRAYDNHETGVNINEKRDKQIVLSLTTYGDRINDVYLTIESLLSQTMKPDRVILWLAKNEFSLDNTPSVLISMADRGLEVRFCDDIKSYKKLVPTLKICPDDIIITVDDDMIYPRDLVECLFKEHLLNNDLIICNRARKITFDNIGNVNPYNKWEANLGFYESSRHVLGIGVGGILYPPHSLDIEVLNEDKFMKLAPHADDLWFKVMALKKNTNYKQTTFGKKINDTKVFLNRFVPTENEQKDKLSDVNVILKKNDEQFKIIMKEYDLMDQLK